MSAAVNSLEDDDEAIDSDGVFSSLLMRLILVGLRLCSDSSSSEPERDLFRTRRTGSGDGDGVVESGAGCSVVLVGAIE